MASVIMGRGEDTEAQRRRRCQDGGSHRRDTPACQGAPRLTGSHQNQGDAGDGFSLRASRRHQPWQYLVSDFWTSELWQYRFLSLEAPQLVVVDDGCPRKWTQGVPQNSRRWTDTVGLRKGGNWGSLRYPAASLWTFGVISSVSCSLSVSQLK